MNLYNLTLHPTATSIYAITGNFLSTDGGQEIVVVQGGFISLLRPDSSGQLKTLHRCVEHSFVCSLARITTSDKDRVLIGHNSVNVSIIGYTNPEYPKIEKYYQIKFKNPIHVSVQFFTSDPYGRAFMFATTRESKSLVCILADKSTSIDYKLSTVPYSITALDGWDDTALVAAIVPDSSGAAMKYISYYSVDVMARYFFEIGTCVVDNEVNLVVAVPGGKNGPGPGGALLCARNKIIYKKLLSVDDVTADIPLICGFSWEQGNYVISAATYHENSFILQMESGDVFEATLIFDGTSVNEIEIKYIDTIPATSAMCILKEGLLFMGSKSGNHALYRENGEMVDIGSSYVLRGPRGLKNLVRIDSSKSFTHMKVMKVNFFKEEAIQAVALHGQGPSSSMRIMRPGLGTTSKVVKPRCRAPDAVWTVKKNANDRFHTYIVTSSEKSNSTHVFLMNGKSVPGNAGVISTTSSLVVCSFGNNSILQVHRRGVRHIKMNDGKIEQYEVEEDIVKVGCNRYQVVVAFSGGELRYYCLLPTDCIQYVGKYEMHLEVACLSIPDPWEERTADSMAVCLYDNKIRILCLSPLDRLWAVVTEETVSSQPESLLFLYISNRSVGQPGSLFLNVGLNNGVLIRRVMTGPGELFLLPSKYLGSRPPKLYAVTINGQPAMLCLSSRIWLGYNHHGRFILTPLYCEALKSVASYSSALWKEGVIAIVGGTMGIFTIECMGDTFNEKTHSLKGTTRKFMLQHEQKHITIIESDHSAFLAIEREADKKGCLEAAASIDGNANNCVLIKNRCGGSDNDKEEEDPLPLSRTIVSDTRLVEQSCYLELKDNEAACSACNMNFYNNEGYGPLLVVGTDFRDSSTAGSIHIYRFLEKKLCELLPSMQLEGVPRALCHIGGRLLLAGIGPVLRMYHMGKTELHEICEIELFPKTNTIVSIQVHQNIFIVGDSEEMIHRFEYRTTENKLYAIKYANVPRRLSASLPIDSDIMAGADKFGNVFFVQFPPEVNLEDPTSSTMLRGVPKEVNEIVHFHVGDVVTCLLKAPNREGGECIIYGTATGNLGAFLSLSMEDTDFFLRLEVCMRREYAPLCHWDRKTDQSARAHVIDGDLCEQFETLSHCSQEKIANELGSTVVEILRKLGDIKSKVI